VAANRTDGRATRDRHVWRHGAGAYREAKERLKNLKSDIDHTMAQLATLRQMRHGK
jgi:hypothetical protein